MKEREKFGTRLGFILVSAGCAVGLGNVWKFPYICGENGGAAFIIIYLFFLLLLGFPIIMCEFAVGRASGVGTGMCFDKLEPKGGRWHRFKWGAIGGSYILMMFYTMVGGWMLYYAYKMATGQLSGLSKDKISGAYDQMLQSPGTMAFWMMVAIVVSLIVCAMGVQNGVERITKVMMLALFLLIVVLAVNSVRLDGAMEGVKFYLVPNLDAIRERGLGTVIFDAMTHAFFTLSVGIGAMEIFGSYLGKERKLTGEAINVLVLDTLIAFVAGIIVIPACISFGIRPDAGPSLLFITLPNVFNHMPSGTLWGMLFFVFMSFAAFSTVLAVFENIISMSMDVFGWERRKALTVNLVGIAVLSMPTVLGFNVWSGVQLFGPGSTIMDVEDFVVSSNILPLGSLLFVLFCTKKSGWGFERFLEETNTGVGMNFPKFLRRYMRYVLPMIVLVIYFKGYYDKFKDSSPVIFGVWMMIAIVFAVYILYLSRDKKVK